MADDKLTLRLEKRVDGDQQTYYIAKLKAPVSIDARDGICFIIFVSEEGFEEMQICNLTKPKKQWENNDR